MLSLYDGPAFSGRSLALRSFGAEAGGGYLHPVLDANLTGLAQTLKGELFLHHQAPDMEQSYRETLLQDLPADRMVMSLSGGETVRLLLACALSSSPRRLAIDTVLEQLDPASRVRVVETVLQPFSRTRQVHVCDNAAEQFSGMIDDRIRFERPEGAPDLNIHMDELIGRVSAGAVVAPRLGVDRLSFRYGRHHRPIFRDATFEFVPGRAYLLKAANGTGKSTLARLLLGVLEPDAGAILVDGAPFPAHRRTDNLVSYCFQNPLQQVCSRSANTYLSEIAAIAARRPTFLSGGLGMSPEHTLSLMGLSLFAGLEPFEVPFIAAKRLTLAAALLSRSPWLFLDEPALGADAAGREALRRLVAALCHAGFGMIIVTHGDEFDSLPGTQTVTITEGKFFWGG